jgi:trk system potassium uptake protein TrkA
MDIIIAGAGRVGFNLARTLSIGHNVTIIDKNSEALQRLQESLDILPINGDIEDPLTYKKLIDKRADLFIAVTDVDEANLISTLIAGDTIDVKRKLIRLKNHFFAKSSIKEKLGIDEAIFPLELTSNTTAMLMEYPKANNVKSFKHTNFKLISVRASSISEPTIITPEKFSIVGIERGKEFFIPKPNEPIKPKDLVYLFGDDIKICSLCEKLETNTPQKIEKCVIFGAGELGVAIAKVLIEDGKEVKLIEKDLSLCKKADTMLKGEAMTISCKYGTKRVFEEEGLEYADVMIAATNNDEYNIIKCLEAKDYGIEKVIAVNNEMEYYNLMHSLGIAVVRGPKMSAYNAILESIYSSGVVMGRKFCGGKGTIYLRKIFPGSELSSKKLKPLKKDNTAIFILRNNSMIPLREKIECQENDVIVAFCTEEIAPKVKVWIYEL